MKNQDKFPDEKAVEVTVKITPTGEKGNRDADTFDDLETVKRWVIMDTSPELARLARYRSDSPLKADNAWTQSVYLARWFLTEALAQESLEAMWKERLILAERAAHRAEVINPHNPAKV